MTADVTSQCVQIKAVLAGLQQFKITSTARIVALLAACGVTKVSEVSALSGVCERMVRKAMKELDAAKRNQSSEDGTRVPEPGFRKGNQGSENVEPEFRPRVRAPARKESPSGISYSEEGKLPPFTPQSVKQRPSAGKKSGSDYWASAMNPEAFDGGVRLDGNRIVLTGETYDRWFAHFGDKLELVLIDVFGWVQPNSSRPLNIQVESQLARRVMQGQRASNDFRADRIAKNAEAMRIIDAMEV